MLATALKAGMSQTATIWLPSEPTRRPKFTEQVQPLPKIRIEYVVIEDAWYAEIVIRGTSARCCL